MEEKDAALVMLAAKAPVVAAAADRTAESGSRRRRTTAEMSLGRCEDRERPWEEEREARRRSEAERTAARSAVEVEERELMKRENVSAAREGMMDSSSAAAAACVSRSESFVMQVSTRCRRSRDVDEDRAMTMTPHTTTYSPAGSERFGHTQSYRHTDSTLNSPFV
uniref:Uncharacterized protein n=1 Tax=Opuntia streptacantha TaxID=393608 RepID=A0A7C8ZYM8_OPUST